MIMVLKHIKNGWMGIDFEQHITLILMMEERPQEGILQATLNNGYLPNLKLLPEWLLKK